MNWEARAKALQEKLDQAEYQLESLRSALEAEPTPHFSGLSPSEAAMATLLRKRSPNAVSKQQFMDLLYGLRSDADVVEAKIIDVFICKMRPKLALVGVDIETVWGSGYRMPSASAAAWDAAA